MCDKITVEVINEEQADEIRKEQKSGTRQKRLLMKSQPVSISPSAVLFDSVCIAQSQMSRLQALSQHGDLSLTDIRKYALLVNTFVKLIEAERDASPQSHLTGKTDKEIIEQVLAAVDVIREVEGETDE